MFTRHNCIPVSKPTSIKSTIQRCLIMCIVIVKELSKKYFTIIKKFVYISVIIIKLNFENPKNWIIFRKKIIKIRT